MVNNVSVGNFLLLILTVTVECFQVPKLLRQVLRLEPSWTPMETVEYNYQRVDHLFNAEAQSSMKEPNEQLYPRQNYPHDLPVVEIQAKQVQFDDDDDGVDIDGNDLEELQNQGPPVFTANTGVNTGAAIGMGIAAAILIPLGAVATFAGLARLFSPLLPGNVGADFTGVGLGGGLFGDALSNFLNGRTTTIYTATTASSVSTTTDTLTLPAKTESVTQSLTVTTTLPVQTQVVTSTSISTTTLPVQTQVVTSTSISTTTRTVILETRTTVTCCACKDNGMGMGNANCGECKNTPTCGARRRVLEVFDLEEQFHQMTIPIQPTPSIMDFWRNQQTASVHY